MISGIQHFIFAHVSGHLYIEQIWEDNVRTFNGHKFHKRLMIHIFLKKEEKL